MLLGHDVCTGIETLIKTGGYFIIWPKEPVAMGQSVVTCDHRESMKYTQVRIVKDTTDEMFFAVWQKSVLDLEE